MRPCGKQVKNRCMYMVKIVIRLRHYGPQSLFADFTLALKAALDPTEVPLFPIVWRGDWVRYTQLYIKHVQEKYMG